MVVVRCGDSGGQDCLDCNRGCDVSSGGRCSDCGGFIFKVVGIVVSPILQRN